MMKVLSSIALFFVLVAISKQECKATCPVAERRESEDGGGKDNTDNQSNVPVQWQNLHLKKKLLLSI